MSKLPFTKLDKELSLSEKIEQQLIEAIRQKIFLPGDKLLGEVELANNFGVSRTAVREALHRLAGRGIVEIRRNAGVFVAENYYTPVTNSLFHLLEMKSGESSLVNIASVRLIIEPENARLAAQNRTDNELKSFREVFASMESHINAPEEMIKFDILFHRLIASSTKNPILPVMMEPLFQLMEKFISDTYARGHPHSPVLALKSHRKILEAIINKDSRMAAEAMQIHMREAKDHAMNISTAKK